MRELASDHAGETGAVSIYRGAAAALRVTPDKAAVAFVEDHLRSEEEHLRHMDALLPQRHQSALLPAWKAAGFALGFLPTALGGTKWLFSTVQAVETFVEQHYAQQTNNAELRAACPSLVNLLEHCAADETHHKEDAAARTGGLDGTAPGKAWAFVVDTGSRAAVALARVV